MNIRRTILCLFTFLMMAGCRQDTSSTSAGQTPPSASVSLPSASAGSSSAAFTRPRRLSRLPGLAKEVVEENGNIVAKDESGNEAELTSIGLDRWPALSPDRRTAVFSRMRTRGALFPRDIYLARVDGGAPELLVADDPSVLLDHLFELSGVRAPEFSIDGKRVFFLIDNGFQNDVLCAIDLATKKISLIIGRWDHRLIRQGAYQGHFLVLRRVPSASGAGREPACSIVDSESGKTLRPHDCQETKGLVGEDNVFGL